LKVSSEIFQRKLTEAVDDLNGTFTIADDIIIAGCGQTDEEAKPFASFGSTSSSVVKR
jgi:hypothetical protein